MLTKMQMENVDLFGEALKAPPKTPTNRTAKRMYGNLIQVYGKVEGMKCKNCKHCHRYRCSQTFYKCAIAEPNVKSGPAGDWRVGWDACGKFEQE